MKFEKWNFMFTIFTVILILLKLEFLSKLYLRGFISSSGMFDSSMEIVEFTDSLHGEHGEN